MAILERNVGDKDKMIRIGAGAVLVVLGLLTSKWLVILGIILLVTGFLNFCGLYKLLGINTANATEQAVASDDLLERASNTLSQVKEEASDAYDKAKQTTTDTINNIKSGETAKNLQEYGSNIDMDKIKQKASEVAETVKEKAADLYENAKDKAGDAGLKVKHAAEDAELKAKHIAEDAKTEVKYGTDSLSDKTARAAHNIKQGAENLAQDVKQAADNIHKPS